jgi:hypothetical protein
MIIKDLKRIKENGEVFTPNELVLVVLKMIDEHVWFDPDKTWLEPSCGDGNFLVAILVRLMESLRDWQPNDNKRHQHIIENMLFGIDLMQDNVDACIERLNAGHLKHHIVCADALTYHYRFDEWETVEEKSLFVWPEKKIA